MVDAQACTSLQACDQLLKVDGNFHLNCSFEFDQSKRSDSEKMGGLLKWFCCVYVFVVFIIDISIHATAIVVAV